MEDLLIALVDHLMEALMDLITPVNNNPQVEWSHIEDPPLSWDPVDQEDLRNIL